MRSNQIPVTREGYERLTNELRELKEIRRPQIVASVAEARSHGDLRENAAYDAARQDQAMNEKRIADLEAMVRGAVILDETRTRRRDVVELGSTVVVDFDGEEERYKIVGAIEAKPTNGLISNVSPIGQALLGKCLGQETYVVTPGGRTRITIKAIES
ncbi:MAG: transcription elongation factor GreA [Chloroflexota bacterium]|nr:transcription elongation factor GreA [Chloroflexota bacterium]